jgi:Kef-type K+ transport system membrane component KefB
VDVDLGRDVMLALVCLIAYAVGEVAARVRIPRLPVYLAVGALSGAVITSLRATAEVTFPKLSTVALAVIGFIAGSHLVWRVVRPRIRPISAQVVSMTIAVPLVVGVTVALLLTDMSTGQRLAGAILAGTVMLALSPPEAIAVISESRAVGPFTELVLGATVVMDVVVVSTFSVSIVVAQRLVGAGDTTSSVLLSVVLMLVLAIVGGVAVGGLLRAVVERGSSKLLLCVLVIGVGAVTAALAPALTTWAEDEFGISVELDSLLLAMIGGVVVANSTRRPERFVEALEAMAPYVYVVFFTLTGLGLHLDALAAAASAAALLWLLRGIGMFVGSTSAMAWAREPAVVRKVAWRAYMPQAGIALALASTIAAVFPQEGAQLSTIIIATVVLNEASGPFFLRSALTATGEMPAHDPLPHT